MKELELTKEGAEIAEGGSHEYKVFQAIGQNGAAQPDIEVPEEKYEVLHERLERIWEARHFEGTRQQVD